jgi:hypothetical protein
VIANLTDQELHIQTFYQNQLKQSLMLTPFENGLPCSYRFEDFLGYKLTECEIDSIVFRFSNGKGYISSINNATNYEFPNEDSPFGNSSKFRKILDVYQFEITQSDYENAFVLP